MSRAEEVGNGSDPMLWSIVISLHCFEIIRDRNKFKRPAWGKYTFIANILKHDM